MMGPYIPVIASLLVSVLAVFVNYKISKHTIDTNRKLNAENSKINAENAGKNRIIYEIERLNSPGGMEIIKKKLETGNWTVLSSFSDPGNFSNVIIILGKIKP